MNVLFELQENRNAKSTVNLDKQLKDKQNRFEELKEEIEKRKATVNPLDSFGDMKDLLLFLKHHRLDQFLQTCFNQFRSLKDSHVCTLLKILRNLSQCFRSPSNFLI